VEAAHDAVFRRRDADPTEHRTRCRSGGSQVTSGVAEPRVAASSPPAAAPSRWRDLRRTFRRHRLEYLIFLALAAPNLILIALFVYRPLILNIYYSTLNWNLGASTARVVGFGNYVEWFSDPHSWTVLRVTAIFTIVTVGGSLVLGLLLALVLNRRLHGAAFARATVFAPYVLSGVGIGLVWLFIFDPTYGALAAILRAFGASSPDWYLDRNWALVMVMIVYVWKNLGYTAVIYLAGLQSISSEVLEAADMDGATATRKLFSVKIPLLSPTTMFLVVTLMLSSLQAFDIIQIMTKGGPFDGTTTLMFQVYQEAFVNGRAGYSSTVAIILFVLLFLMTFLYLRFVERKVTYQ
jgi:sn-glycerol 3-phosphate transport system permease protein